MRRILVWFIPAALAWAADAPNPTNISATHSNGQTFVTWTDPLAGAAGQDLRYRVYRSTTCPITSTASATLIMDGLSVFNNSGQFNGQVIGQGTRTNASQTMVKIPGNGSPLAAWTGLAVHTATANEPACYAVVSYDRTGSTYATPSAIVAGANSMAGTVAETVSAIQPVKQRGDTFGWGWTGASKLPMYLCLHASSQTNPWPYGGSVIGVPDGIGDLYAMWGDSTMSWQEGVQQMWDVYQTTTLHRACDPRGIMGAVNTSSLFLAPRDGKYRPNGTTEMEDSWFGFYAQPFGGGTARTRNFTEDYLSRAIAFSQSAYSADTNRLYSVGGSLGAWGTLSFAFHHPELFAAVFPDRPRWRPANTIYNLDADSYVSVNSSSPLMEDGATSYRSALDSVAYVTARAAAGQSIPWVGWAIGRQDGFATWQEQVDAVNALKAAKAGFAFCWDNGTHGTSIWDTTIRTQYVMSAPTKFARNLSYPAFGNFSLDANPGNGDPANGDLTGCINGGFSWTSVSESANSWTAAVSNSTVGATATVDITPRNTHSFVLAPGKRVGWTASTGQSGTATADAHGLATAPGVTIQAGSATTVTFTAKRVLFPLPTPVRR